MSEAIRILQGDALELLRGLEDALIDAIVTDPPAGISFMGREWDEDKGGRDQWIAWLLGIMRECHRVLKPGAHALVWALPRTSHWTATAIEDAGFEIRDVVMHLFGTGFPKSLDVSKAIDKAAGAEREVVGVNPTFRANTRQRGKEGMRDRRTEGHLTAPATDAAREWQGWGTALKPAAEHWILARKPLVGTVAANVLAHGTGALNVDGCRIAGPPSGLKPYTRQVEQRESQAANHKNVTFADHALGRWPAHVTLDEDAAALLDEQSGDSRSSGGSTRLNLRDHFNRNSGGGCNAGGLGDFGGASRFFYVAKPDPAEREVFNRHPTVKPIDLMRWLCRLVTPPGGLVLDPFAGSGTTGLACHLEGFQFLGFEKEPEYVEIARKRIERRPAAQGRLL